METSSSDSAQSETSRSSVWKVLGKSLPRNEVVFFSQVLLIYVVVITAIINLSFYNSNTQLWIGLLCACLGYLLPSPLPKLPTTSLPVDVLKTIQ